MSSGVTLTTGELAKVAGQQQSMLDLLDEQEGDFLHVIAKVPAGTLFSANRVRDELDDAGVPDKARAGLFRRAVARRLVVPVTVEYAGRSTPLTEPSTGHTAHAAHVRVYARTEVDLRGST